MVQLHDELWDKMKVKPRRYRKVVKKKYPVESFKVSVRYADLQGFGNLEGLCTYISGLTAKSIY